MISQKNLLLAEPIAMAVNAAANPISVKPLIQGLNELSHGSSQYTEFWRTQVPEATRENDHSQVLEATATQLAEIIRGAFDTIKEFGVPFAKAIAKDCSVLYTPARLEELAFSRLKYNFVNVQDPFFDSAIYPTEVKNTVLNFSSISLEVLERLEFGCTSEEEILKFVDSSHPDILQILENHEYSLESSVESLNDLAALQQLFSSEGHVFNFAVIKTLKINQLLKMYVVLTKMYTSDDPAPWFKNGTLEDYREYVSLVWNGMTRYLIALKQICVAYSNRTVVIGEIDPIGMVAHQNEDFQGARFLAGSVQIFYTNQALEVLEQNGVSFQEWLIAMLYTRFNGGSTDAVGMLKDKIRVQEAANAYYNSINSALGQRAESIFAKTARTAAVRFMLDTPALKERVLSLIGDDLPDRWLDKKLDGEFESAYHAVVAGIAAASREADNAVDGLATAGSGVDVVTLDALLATQIVPKFLRAIECNTAAQIIGYTFTKGEGDDKIVDKRQRLHVALIKFIAANSLGV